MQQKQTQLQYGTRAGVSGQQSGLTASSGLTGSPGLTGSGHVVYRQPYNKTTPYVTTMDSLHDPRKMDTIESLHKDQEFYSGYTAGRGQMNEYENIYERPLPNPSQPI